MIAKIIIDRNIDTLVELHYDADSIVNMVCDKTQAYASTMTDKEGREIYEQMSATEDDRWMLVQYMQEAWRDVMKVCSAYNRELYVEEGGKVIDSFRIRLSMPRRWDPANASSVDVDIKGYLVSRVLSSWWLSRGHGELSALERQKAEWYRDGIKYALNVGRVKRPYKGL